ncbi:A-kinase anchor protein 8-like [Hyla sarda]|uniref:A-kinase anchor protein 8-like n=1 Tax=Hyla sarda TaxID=327740 RepID=UPI0024C2235A|nr:A-kinase anchor protein 8-like [Hyla sarda]
MYGRCGDGFMGRHGGPGYNFGPDPYWSSPEPWMPTYDGPDRGSYFDRPERGRYGYSEPERGYRGPGIQGPPNHASPWGRGDSRGGFMGNFAPSRPERGARQPSQPLFPEREQFKHVKPFVDNFFYGGGFKLQENSLKGEQKRKSHEGGQPAAKRMKTSAANKKSEQPGSEGDGNDEELAQGTMSDGEQEAGTQEETESTQSSSKELKEEILDHNLGNRIQFSCDPCQFRTFYEEEWNMHMQTRFHKEHFERISSKLAKKEADFVEAYVENGYKMAKQKREQIEDLSNKIHQIYRRQDHTLGLGIEHFVKKVEIAHCGACDVFLPMVPSTLWHHIQSSSHLSNRKDMMKKSKLMATTKAMSILRDKSNEHKLDQNTNGRASGKNIKSGCSRDLAPKREESGEMPCITLSDSEGEEEDVQGQNDDTRIDCCTELVPETEESEQMPCSTLPDSKRDEEKEDCDGQVTEQETACESL